MYTSIARRLYYAIPPSIAGFAYGWENASMSGILTMDQFLDYFHTPSAYRQGAMTAALLAGEFGGSLLTGFFVADRLGRRKTILSCVLIYLIGQAIIVASQNQAMFIAGRVVNGLGAGGLFQTISLYTAEITPPSIRGMMTSTMSTGIATGLLVAYWIQYAALNIQGTAAWRMCFALQLIPGAAVGTIIFFRPESPRWLFHHDRADEALQVLADLHANGDTTDPAVQAEFEEIRVVVEHERGTPPPSYLALLTEKQYRRRTALAMGLQFMQQISGVNIILYYAAKVFAQTGRTGTSAALLANGIESALFLVASYSLTMLMDVYGRRLPIIIGPTLMGICMIVVASMLIAFGSPHFNATTQAVEFNFADVDAGNTAVAFMFLYMIAFGALFSALPWTYQNEVFPLAARGRGTALSTCTNWFVNFWLGLYMPAALNSASWKLYYVFGGINIAISFVTFLFYPETSQRTLEELDLLFTPDRRKLVFLDRDACRKGSMLGHGLEDGVQTAKELEAALAMGTVEQKEVV
ncbi:hypothetical protein ASPZODRAFT_76671 [Penicilliopsis zonata CBS 506.65]|uniref:Major facilitator superfamily (MFS) profile domain-containing protein n=1 Tax=Penicilliopsis zonata CBS 506.65 TaxID=1073090 RepID=A0A1L9S631_9EURO|nr:hypothetical protein ASPZODRAFT_76671 [Penicilliopsis zonata CBS 506.65]OJJ42605.1 hypothetical protein ASPZODRAFT_76671 [Penicilliopsis zonata CBS 506.65]